MDVHRSSRTPFVRISLCCLNSAKVGKARKSQYHKVILIAQIPYRNMLFRKIVKVCLSFSFYSNGNAIGNFSQLVLMAVLLVAGGGRVEFGKEKANFAIFFLFLHFFERKGK